ncbi:MAG: LysM peptidoglycan-binding domain-containing protein [bacterium]|nr:MAG: LysM peptidoglycan-binding domain-containing protein [bacterium]
MNNLKFNLKKTLKAIKLNESSISMVLGLIVVLIVGSLTVKYLRNDSGRIPEELLNNSIESTTKKHTVAKGENLWILAENYYGDGFKWVDIATENKLENASVIEEGQELIIPNLEIAEVEQTENAITSATYEVVKGDSLWDISVRAYGDGYRWADIAKANNIANPNIIHSGNILVLPR